MNIEKKIYSILNSQNEIKAIYLNKNIKLTDGIKKDLETRTIRLIRTSNVKEFKITTDKVDCCCYSIEKMRCDGWDKIDCDNCKNYRNDITKKTNRKRYKIL